MAAEVTSRAELESALANATPERVVRLLQEPWLNTVAPGASKMCGCDQGTKKHLEGDVAIHTGLVVANLIEGTFTRTGRPPTFIELCAALLHDFKKPATRLALSEGEVSFPGHEEAAAIEIPGIADRLGLTPLEAEELYFLVAYHGEVHGWIELPAQRQAQLRKSPWFPGLARLQEADAKSLLFSDGSHFTVYYNDMILT